MPFEAHYGQCGFSDNSSIVNGVNLSVFVPVYICAYSIVQSILPTLLAFFTIAGNVFVLVAIVVNPKLKKKLTSILLSNLAFADFLVGTVVMPLAVVLTVTNGKWLFGRLICRIWISLDILCCTASIVTLCVISVDRFLGVMHPLRYPSLVTKGRLILAVFGVWIFALSVLLSSIYWQDPTTIVHSPSHTCNVGNEVRYVTHPVIMSFFLPLAIILAVYFQIYQVTKKREQSLLRTMFSNMAGQHGAPKTNGEAELPNATFFPLRIHYGGTETSLDKQRRFYQKHKKSAKTLGLVVGCFCICWLPFFLLYLIENYCGCIPGIVLELFTWMGYANSALNPIIYAVTMRSFGETFKEIILRILCCDVWQTICGAFTSKIRCGIGSLRQSRNSCTSDHFITVTEADEVGMSLVRKLEAISEDSDSNISSQIGHKTSTIRIRKKKSQKRKVSKASFGKSSSFQLDRVKRSFSWMNLKLYQVLVSSEATDL